MWPTADAAFSSVQLVPMGNAAPLLLRSCRGAAKLVPAPRQSAPVASAWAGLDTWLPRTCRHCLTPGFWPCCRHASVYHENHPSGDSLLLLVTRSGKPQRGHHCCCPCHCTHVPVRCAVELVGSQRSIWGAAPATVMRPSNLGFGGFVRTSGRGTRTTCRCWPATVQLGGCTRP